MKIGVETEQIEFKKSTGELSKAMNVSTTAINNVIKELKTSGVLTRNGARKNGVWVVNQ